MKMDIILKPISSKINARINAYKRYIILNTKNINENNVVSTLVHEYIHYIFYLRVSNLAYRTYDNICKEIEAVEIIFNDVVDIEQGDLFPIEEEWNRCCYCNAKLTKSGLCSLCDLHGISDPDDDLFF